MPAPPAVVPAVPLAPVPPVPATGRFTTYGDDVRITGAPAPEVPEGLSGLSRSAVDLPSGRIELVHPRDAMDLIYRQNFGMDGIEPPYWAQPWPSGLELAVAVTGAVTPGMRVLELGCGLALPSLAAARAGAAVLATDHEQGALDFAAYNARCNDLSLAVARCGWGDPVAALDGAPWDLVLAADVLYAHSDLDVLAALLPRLTGDTGEVWIADQGRPPARAFLEAAGRWANVSTTATAHPEVSLHRLRRGPEPAAQA